MEQLNNTYMQQLRNKNKLKENKTYVCRQKDSTNVREDITIERISDTQTDKVNQRQPRDKIYTRTFRLVRTTFLRIKKSSAFEKLEYSERCLWRKK